MRYGTRVATVAAITSLALVACGSSGGSDSAGTTARHRGSRPLPVRRRRPAPAALRRGDSLLGGEIKCDQQYAGKTVSLLSPVRNSENDPNAIQIFTDFWKPLTDCTGVKIDFQGTDQFEVQAPVLLQGGSPPDVIDFPQPGLMRTLAASLKDVPGRRRRARQERLHRRLGRPRHRRRKDQGHAVASQRQVDGVVQPEGLRGEGLQGPRDARRDEGAVRPDRQGRGHPVVRRHRVGRGHRVADHRLVRGLHAAAQRSRGLRPVGQPRHPVQRPEGQGRRRRGRLVPQEPRLHGRREQRQGDRHDEVPGRRCPDHHGQLLHAPAGELLLHAVPRGDEGRPSG